MPIYNSRTYKNLKKKLFMSLLTHRFGSSNINSFGDFIDSAALKLSKQNTLISFPNTSENVPSVNKQDSESASLNRLNLYGIRETFRGFSSPIKNKKPEVPYYEESNLNWNFTDRG